MDRLTKQELWLYAFAWTLVFALVPLSLFIHVLSGHDSYLAWEDILPIWGSILPYLILFLLHNHLAAPLLLKKKPLPYLAVTVTLLAAFVFYCLSASAGPPEGGPYVPDGWEEGFRPAPPDGRRPVEPRVMKMVIGLLVVLVNLGVKAVFMNFRNRQTLQQLQTQSLEQQLETLRYQINPHFFMNTLNNIHALVDLDPEKARESILELSKMMRYILYEGNRPTIPLAQEADFLRHYVSLVRIRYPGEIRIDLSLPADCGEAEVPPLVFASSVENAFKHGISYEAESFVSIEVACAHGRIVFRCSNSRHGAATGGGIGVDNVRKRLELLYDEDFTYTVEATESRYDILMNLPASPGNHPAAV